MGRVLMLGLALLLALEGIAAFSPPLQLTSFVGIQHASCLRTRVPHTAGCRRLSMQAQPAGNLDAAIKDVKERPAVAGGDAAALLVFAAIGRANHGSDDGSVLLTALPFALSWFLLAPVLGAYKPARTLNQAVTGILPAWAISVPLGCVLRGAINGRMPAAPFWVVALVATGVLLGGWRAAHFQALTVSQTVNEFTEAILEDDD